MPNLACCQSASGLASRRALHQSAEVGEDGGEVGGVLEEADGGEAGGAGAKAARGIFEGDAADGQNGDARSAADFAEAVKPLRWTEFALGGRVKNRPEENVVSAIVFGLLRCGKRMAGSSHQEAAARPLGALPAHGLGPRH